MVNSRSDSARIENISKNTVLESATNSGTQVHVSPHHNTGPEQRIESAEEPRTRDPLFWLTLALTIFALAPFMLPGYFWGANDARHHVYFLFEYDRVFQDGIWWPRWSPDFAFGYGYPFFNIYGPFSHALAQFMLRGLNFSYTNSIEIVFGLSILGSASSMYLFVRSWIGRQAAMISALVYVYAPYHLVDMYVRANLAESMAFVWLPFCLWTARQTFVKPNLRWVIGLGISLAGLVMTSQLVTLIFAPLFGPYLILLWFLYTQPNGTMNLNIPKWVRNWSQVWTMVRSATAPALGILSGLGLSAIFWLPMVMERNDVRVDQWFDGRYAYQSNFVYFMQLFSPTWGFGVSRPGPNDDFSFQIGIIPLVLATIGLLLLWQNRRVIGERLCWEASLFAIVAAGTTFVMLQQSAFLWELPVLGGLLGAAQFPWRWLTATTLCVSVLSGLVMHPVFQAVEPAEGRAEGARATSALLSKMPTSQLTFPLFVLVAVIILGSYPLLRVQIIEPAEGPISLSGLMRFQRSSDEMTGSTRWVKEIPRWSPMAGYYETQRLESPHGPIEPVNSKVDYSVLEYDPEAGFVIESRAHNTVMEEVWYFSGQEGRRIIFEHFYYPGWRAYLLDGEGGTPVQELEIIPEEEGTLGRMTVPVPKGEGYVLLQYGDTMPRIVGRNITLGTIVLLLLASVIVGTRYRKFA